MPKERAFLALFLLLLLAFFPDARAKADAGPEPPSMTFYFDLPPRYRIAKIEIHRCSTPTCEQFTVFPSETPQPWERLWCQEEKCIAVGIGSRDYFRLVVYFTNGETLISPTFRHWSYSATYRVQLEGDILRVEEERGCCPWVAVDAWRILLFLPLFGFTLAIETLAAVGYNEVTKQRIGVGYVALANTLSFPIVWFVFPSFVYRATWLTWVAAEVFAFAFEGGLFFLWRRRMGLSGKQAFLLSAINNTASVTTAFGLIGGLVLTKALFLWLFG